MDHLLKSPMLPQECTTEDLMEYNKAAKECVLAPNDTAYKRLSYHSGLKLLWKLCRTFPPRFTVFLGMPTMRTRWMAGAAAHKSG